MFGTKSLLCEPSRIQIHTILQSEKMAAVNAVRDKKGLIPCMQQKTAEADDLIRFLRRKVITDKNITTSFKGGIIHETGNFWKG